LSLSPESVVAYFRDALCARVFNVYLRVYFPLTATQSRHISS
jgi:hypothetical protein